MRRIVLLLIPLLALSAACVQPVFKYPVLVSTKSSAIPPHEVVGEVDSDWCNMLILMVLPIIGEDAVHWEKMMSEAKDMGADAVIDAQARPTTTSAFIPLFLRTCFEVQGTAVRFTQ